MFASIAESFIKKYAGKYLKNFNSDQISINLSTIHIGNFEIKTEEIRKIKIPYKPSRIFVGDLSADLSFFIGGNFEIKIKDILIILDKEDVNIKENPLKVIEALESILSIIYMTTFSSEDNESLPHQSFTEIDSLQRMLDRLIISVENIHIRVEEEFEGHIPNSLGKEFMCSGIFLERLAFITPGNKELVNKPNYFLSKSIKDVLVLNKQLIIEGLSVYCMRDIPWLSPEEDPNVTILLTKDDIKRDLFIDPCPSKGFILSKTNFTLSISIGYQRRNRVFGPIKIDLNNDMFCLAVNDEQLMYLMMVIECVKGYFMRLQLQSRITLNLTSTIDPKRRARQRWGLIRSAIKADWWKYASSLTDGVIRWRYWFEVWRAAGRYIALREILIPHVGHEVFHDNESGFSTMHTFENLKLYYSSYLNQHIIPNTPPLCIGEAEIDPEILNLASALIRRRIRGEEVTPSTISSGVLKALYAIQLQLDAFLPPNIIAYCRIMADVRFNQAKEKNKKIKLRRDSAHNSNNSRASKRLDLQVTSELYLFPIEITNIQPSFGSTSLHVFLTAGLQLEGEMSILGETPVVHTRTQTSTSKTFSQFKHLYTVPLDQTTLENMVDTGSLVIDAYNRSLLTVNLGQARLPFSTLQTMLSEHFPKPSTEYSSAIETLTLDVKMLSSLYSDSTTNNNSSTSDENKVQMKVLAMAVTGNVSYHIRAQERFTTIMEAILKERKTILERSLLYIRPQASDDLEDEVFILDPNQLTLQDIQLTVSLGSIKVLFSGIYSYPVDVRSNLLIEHGIILPHETQVPICSLNIKNLLCTAKGSNNPIMGGGQVSWDTFDFQSHHPEEQEINKEQCLTLHLPKITTYFSFDQTSTMSRSVDGNLDWSCFDVKVKTSLFPFEVSFAPLALLQSSPSALTIWKSFRPLSHLWLPPAEWSKVFTNLNKYVYTQTMGRYRWNVFDRYSEAQTRLGDVYTFYPIHLNVINEVKASFKTLPVTNEELANAESSGCIPLPRQVSNIRSMTTGYAMDLAFQLAPQSVPLPLEATILSSNEPPVGISASSSTSSKPGVGSSKSATGGFFGWFGDANNKGSTPPLSTQTLTWEEERNLLLKRIQELETQVASKK